MTLKDFAFFKERLPGLMESMASVKDLNTRFSVEETT